MRFILFRSFARLGLRPWLLLLSAAWLAGCSPEYDWRRVQPIEGGFAAMLPAKPSQMSQRVDLDGLPIEMTLHGARVGEVAYTVGVLRLPDDTPATRERVLAALRQSMVSNIRGTVSNTTQVSVRIDDAQGQRSGSQPAQQIEVSGRMRDAPATMTARFLGRGDHVWQVMVLAPQPAQQRAGHAESVALFLDGFVLINR